MVLITVPIQIVWNVPDSSFTRPLQTDEVTCRVVMVLGDYGNYLSGFIIMIISIDRMMAVRSPVAHRC